MKRKGISKLLVIALTLVMLVGMLPAAALADGGWTKTDKAQFEEDNGLARAYIGDASVVVFKQASFLVIWDRDGVYDGDYYDLLEAASKNDGSISPDKNHDNIYWITGDEKITPTDNGASTYYVEDGYAYVVGGKGKISHITFGLASKPEIPDPEPVEYALSFTKTFSFNTAEAATLPAGVTFDFILEDSDGEQLKVSYTTTGKEAPGTAYTVSFDSAALKGFISTDETYTLYEDHPGASASWGYSDAEYTVKFGEDGSTNITPESSAAPNFTNSYAPPVTPPDPDDPKFEIGFKSFGFDTGEGESVAANMTFTFTLTNERNQSLIGTYVTTGSEIAGEKYEILFPGLTEDFLVEGGAYTLVENAHRNTRWTRDATVFSLALIYFDEDNTYVAMTDAEDSPVFLNSYNPPSNPPIDPPPYNPPIDPDPVPMNPEVPEAPEVPIDPDPIALDDTPMTGEESSMGLLIALLILSATGIAAVTAISRKRKTATN